MANINLKACFNAYFSSKAELVHYGTACEGEYLEPVYRELSRASVWAIVTSNDKALERLPETARVAGSISVRYQEDDAPDGFTGGAHDRVIFNGREYAVADNVDSAHIGHGFKRLLCTPTEVTGL